MVSASRAPNTFLIWRKISLLPPKKKKQNVLSGGGGKRSLPRREERKGKSENVLYLFGQGEEGGRHSKRTRRGGPRSNTYRGRGDRRSFSITLYTFTKERKLYLKGEKGIRKKKGVVVSGATPSPEKRKESRWAGKGARGRPTKKTSKREESPVPERKQKPRTQTGARRCRHLCHGKKRETFFREERKKSPIVVERGQGGGSTPLEFRGEKKTFVTYPPSRKGERSPRGRWNRGRNSLGRWGKVAARSKTTARISGGRFLWPRNRPPEGGRATGL